MNNPKYKPLQDYVEKLPYVHHVGQIIGEDGANGVYVQLEAFVNDLDNVHTRLRDDVKKEFPRVKLWSQIFQYRELVKKEEEKNEKCK